MPQPYQIRLVVNRNDAAKGYTARWIESDGQESAAPFPLVLPLTIADASDLRWYLETYYQFPGAGDRKRAQGIEQKLKTWGHRLFDAVFDTSEGKDVYRNVMRASDAGQPCLLTIGATDPDILVQPWEMMRDKRGPLAFQGVTIRRQLKGSGRYRPGLKSRDWGSRGGRGGRGGLRILLIVSRPNDTGFIDPRNSIAPMLDALDALPPGQVTVDFCDPPTLPQLEQTISQARKAKQPYHIVHFDGHGTYLPKTGVGALCFERDNGASHLVRGTEMGDLLARLDVPLVLLEACRSSDLSDQPVFGSVAPALLESGVGSVIAFSHAVHIHAARLLVERFYRELTLGLTVGQALEEARAALHANPARWLHRGPNAETIDVQDWFIPQLYQIGPDPTLIAPTPQSLAPGPQSLAPRPLLPGFPPPPMYRFHGRALELLEMERAFRRHPAALLSGMGGMGKTALAREAAAWWLRTGRFDAAIFCSFEHKAGAERVVQLIGQALEKLDAPGTGAESDEFSARPADEQWTTAVDLFRQRRVLLVWDNFESTLPIYQHDTQTCKVSETLQVLAFNNDARAQLHQLYRDLTTGQPQGRLLVTCRPAETGLPALKELPLQGLARPDSLHLLAAVLDIKSISTDRDGYERAEIDALLDNLDDHPLSIELIAPHLKTLPPAQIRTEFSALLERFADEHAHEGRNRSLLASLEFSKKRISESARDVLPYLAWFEGGVFEAFLLAFTELDPQAWAAIRAELVATALVSVEEEGIQINKRPYIRFHPTLPYAARPTDVARRGGADDPETAEQRFIAVYLSVRKIARNALRGSQPAAGMALVAQEQTNLRAAIHHAFRRGARHEGWQMADTLGVYLQMAGRLRERDALAAWVRDQMPDGAEDGAGLDTAACAATRQYAWSRLTQGHADEAVQMVQTLITRLESEGLAGGQDPSTGSGRDPSTGSGRDPSAGSEHSPAFQIAVSYRNLGQIYVAANRPDLALEPAQKAIALFEPLPGDAARGNLSASLGDLANAYSALGRFDEALEAAERGLSIDRDLGRDREIAAGLTRSAAILTGQQRYAEADARYAEALHAAQAAGDLGLQGAILQHQGSLHRRQGHHDRAVELYKQAIGLFQRAANTEGEMQTCDALASAEMQRGHLDAAEAWYARSRELALQLNDRAQLAANAHNVGILYQNRAEQATDPATRAALLRQALASVEESLAITLERQNQVAAALSYGQLGVLHRMLGELEQAEENARQAMEIRESLNLPDVYKDYNTLANIARDRGDAQAAARWQAKYETKLAELQRLRRGGQDPKGFGKPLGSLILALAQAVYQARVAHSPLPPDAAEGLAQLAELAPPLGAVGAFLQVVAAGQPVPPLPPGLPPELAGILEQLIEAASE